MILIARLCGLIMLMLTGLALAAPAPERRVALVIGNSSYRNAPVLPNTVNDAGDMAAALRKVGFEVIDGIDLDKRGMDALLTRFARLAQDADSAMFYFAGHGFQFNGENYLVPIEAKIEDEVGVQYETMRLNDVVTALNYAKGVKIMVLDACRNNPFVNQLARRQATRGFSVGSGLAPVARAQGMVIAYATQDPKMQGDEIKTRGGAFRSNGQWYHVAYRCLTAPDRMQILSLRYKIGDKIPEDEWDQYNLYP